MQQPLTQLAQELAQRLIKNDRKVVFAESCTAGLISATLARIPGVSNVHCGSAVVYRLDTKTEWLGVPTEILNAFGAVSEEVAHAMAEGVLAETPEADIAATITGHLGPGAPEELDGLIFVGITERDEPCRVFKHVLQKYRDRASYDFPGDTEREQRQWAAVEFVLSALLNALKC